MTTLLRHVELATGAPADVTAVERVMTAAFDSRFGEAWTRTQVLGGLAMPGVTLLLARVGEATVGFSLTRRVLDEAELLLIAVIPDARRRGVGAALLRGVIAEARGAGAAKLHLEVREGNPAIQLYTAAGFAKTGERRAYYRGRDGRAHDAHSYALTL
jgi:ribosomal-protein-alanine N-acetyltransferase